MYVHAYFQSDNVKDYITEKMCCVHAVFCLQSDYSSDFACIYALYFMLERYTYNNCKWYEQAAAIDAQMFLILEYILFCVII